MKYVVLRPIWHRGDQRHYEPGSKVSLSHLSAQDINRVVALGIVRPIPKIVVPVVKKPAGTLKKTTKKPRKKAEVKKPVPVMEPNLNGDNRNV